MRSMFAYFTPTKPSGEPFTRTDRCLQALQLVAMGWLLAGTLPFGFESNLRISAEVHQRLGTLQLICVFISAAIQSVLIPLRHILLEKKD
jgi:hypothetical protein